MNSKSLVFNSTSQIMVDPSYKSLQFTLCGYQTTVYDYYYDLTDEHFSRLRFDFDVRRKSSFYVINLIFPIATLSFIEPLIFFIPLRGLLFAHQIFFYQYDCFNIDSGSDRVGFGTTVSVKPVNHFFIIMIHANIIEHAYTGCFSNNCY